MSDYQIKNNGHHTNPYNKYDPCRNHKDHPSDVWHPCDDRPRDQYCPPNDKYQYNCERPLPLPLYENQRLRFRKDDVGTAESAEMQYQSQTWVDESYDGDAVADADGGKSKGKDTKSDSAGDKGKDKGKDTKSNSAGDGKWGGCTLNVHIGDTYNNKGGKQTNSQDNDTSDVKDNVKNNGNGSKGEAKEKKGDSKGSNGDYSGSASGDRNK
jgi:hypothetical protein